MNDASDTAGRGAAGDPGWMHQIAAPLSLEEVRDQLFTPLRECGYEQPAFDDPNHTVTAVRTTQIAPPLSGTRSTLVVLNWTAAGPAQTLVRWRTVDKSPGSGGRPDQAAADQLLKVLSRALAPATAVTPAKPDPIVAPGGTPPGTPFTGTLRDYSGFARKDEVADLASGVLPLGHWAFVTADGVPDPGPDLFMKPDPPGPKGQKRLREYRGTLLCAPQNSGKTSLIVRWAKAANARNQSIFLIDVKGNLHGKLEQELNGTLYYFSTNPDESCDRINFLSGLDPLTPRGREMIREITEALLPQDAGVIRSAKDDILSRSDAIFLNAMINLVKLRDAYRPGYYYTDEHGQPREPDLGDLYEVARDEDVLCRWITDLRTDEDLVREAGLVPPICGVDYWVQELILLLGEGSLPPRFLITEEALDHTGDGALDPKVAAALKPLVGKQFGNAQTLEHVAGKAIGDDDALQANLERLQVLTAMSPEGQRDPEYGYRQYTHGIVAALEPFARHGTLYPKIRSVGPGRLFDLRVLDDAAEKVTVLIAAREQDQEKAKTVLSVVIRRLQHVLFDRMQRSETELTPILLLLDETRRIRAFKANEYITFAREAQAACVVAYQSIDQIGNEAAITEILENVGTQIYLGTVAGNTARAFIKMLPMRHRPVVSEQIVVSGEGVRGRTMSLTRELGDYFSTAELYALPPGRFGAVVYLNDLPRRKPILVDMTDAALTAAERAAPR